MKCLNCDKEIPENLNYCPSCITNKIDKYYVENKDIIKQRNNKWAIISFILISIPYIYGIFHLVTSSSSISESILIVLLIWTILRYITTPLLILAIILGFKGLKSEIMALSFLAILLSIPFIIFSVFILFGQLS